jgi:class 3 adenylate cyclase
MASEQSRPPRFDVEMGACLEEVCADLCRFECATSTGRSPAEVWVEREVPLGGGYADIRVSPPGGAPFYVENKLEYAPADLVARIRAKYGKGPFDARRLAVVLDRKALGGSIEVDGALREAVSPDLALDLWDVHELRARIRVTFGCDIPDLSHASLLGVRSAIERAHWRQAFGDAFDDYPAAGTLLWHFSPWELARLHREEGMAPDDILQPRVYEDVVVVMADLCSFSSYVRDTRDSQQIRRRLTEFYSLARHAVLNAGGMLYQFVGDEVVGMFGLHEDAVAAAARAVRCVRALFDAGNAVSQAWQRSLDRVQPSRGVHVGVAAGDLALLALRPFSRSHLGFIGDALNLSARLMAEAASSEAVVSNTVYTRLGSAQQTLFQAIEPIEAKNVGRIRGWRLTQRALESADLGR